MKLNETIDESSEIENIIKEINGEKFKTAINKVKFINSIKNEFGEDLKANPRKVTIIKTSLLTKVGLFFKKILSSV